MNKKFIAALLAIACYGIHANAQAIIVTKSNDNKIVLPANNVKDITTTTDNLAESLDYYTKDEADNQLEELRVRNAANESGIDYLMNHTNNLEGEIHALKANMCDLDYANYLETEIHSLKAYMANKDMQIDELQAEMAKKNMEIEVLTKELKDLREQLQELRDQISSTRDIIFYFHQ